MLRLFLCLPDLAAATIHAIKLYRCLSWGGLAMEKID